MNKAELIFKQAHDSVRDELAELVRQYEDIERRIVRARQTLRSLAAECKSKGINVDPSPEARQLEKMSSLSDDIRAILKQYSPAFVRPNTIKLELVALGHDLDSYQNPLATIYSLLNRMIEAGDVEETRDSSGTRIFCWLDIASRISPKALTPHRLRYVEDKLPEMKNNRRV